MSTTAEIELQERERNDANDERNTANHRGGDACWWLDSAALAALTFSEEDIKFHRTAVNRYYLDQRRLVTHFGEAESLLQSPVSPGNPIVTGASRGGVASHSASTSRSSALLHAIGMHASLIANIGLLAAKLVAAVQSGSLSILASVADSVLDLLTGIALFITQRAVARTDDKHTYPVGKSKLTPAAVTLFSTVMSTLALLVFVEGIRQLVSKRKSEIQPFNFIIGIMASVIAVKLLLWLFCRLLRSPALQAYAQDHRNDVLTNSLGLTMALLGDRVAYWYDPLGAMLLSVYVMLTWASTCVSHVRMLTAESAPTEVLQKITFIASKSKCDRVDKVLAYSFGQAPDGSTGFFVEVDIVVTPPDTALHVTHDIGEELQQRLEQLPEIVRAHVHIDFEYSHPPTAEHIL